MSRWCVREEPALSGFCIEWLEAGYVVLSQGPRLYQTSSLNETPSRLATLPLAPWRRLLAETRPTQRLFRLLYNNVLRLADGSLFLTFDKSVYVLRGGKFVEIGGLCRPCRVLRGACAVDRDGSVYLGEYRTNVERGPVSIYRYQPGARSLEVVHTFAPGGVRHVHGIYPDVHTNALWCLTGDRGSECRILVTYDGFKTFEAIGQGDETWRAVSALFTRHHVYYAMDAEFQRNVLYRFDRVSRQREALAELDGPVYYSTAVNADLFFAVTAELCPSQPEPCASLWHVSASSAPSRILSMPKDRLPVRYFMPGTLHFPLGPGLGDCALYVHAVGLEKSDNRTFRLTSTKDK